MKNFAYLVMFSILFLCYSCDKSFKDQSGKSNSEDQTPASISDSLKKYASTSNFTVSVKKYFWSIDLKTKKKTFLGNYLPKDAPIYNPYLTGVMFMEYIEQTYTPTYPYDTTHYCHQYNKIVQVEPDFVCVGGGARINYKLNPRWASGAYLTESRPVLSKSGWQASSKDQIDICPHSLTVGAIGIQVNGLSKQTLLDNIRIRQDSFITASHAPTKTVPAASGWSVISGGARITSTGYGVLLIESRSINGGWIATGHDDINSDTSGKIVSYIVEIKNDSIPGFGKFKTSTLEKTKTTGASRDSVYFYNVPWNGSSVITSIGGKSIYTGYGRFFTELNYLPVSPDYDPLPSDINDGIKVVTKDHKRLDYTNEQVYGQIITLDKQ